MNKTWLSRMQMNIFCLDPYVLSQALLTPLKAVTLLRLWLEAFISAASHCKLSNIYWLGYDVLNLWFCYDISWLKYGSLC